MLNNNCVNLPFLKNSNKFKLKPLSNLEYINIFAMPSKINDRDIFAMFNGLIKLITEKVRQEQSEKYLRLKLEYSRIKKLYFKTKLKQLDILNHQII